MRSGWYDVGCLQSLGALLDIECHTLSFCQCFESIPGNCREMNENIIAAISRRDKTKALGFVEPFNSSCGHVTHLVFLCVNVIQSQTVKGKYRRCGMTFGITSNVQLSM